MPDADVWTIDPASLIRWFMDPVASFLSVMAVILLGFAIIREIGR